MNKHDIKDKENCLKLANEIAKLVAHTQSTPIEIQSNSMGVIVDEVSFTGQYAAFYFGEAKPPFNIIKSNNKDFNYARVEIMNTLQSNKSSDFIEYNDIIALVNELADDNTKRGLKNVLDLLKDKGFQVKSPTLSTNKTILFIYLVKYEMSVNFNVKAEFYNHAMLGGTD